MQQSKLFTLLFRAKITDCRCYLGNWIFFCLIAEKQQSLEMTVLMLYES